MMRRYGRNQKRRHLREIKAISEQLLSTSAALNLNYELSRSLGNKVRELTAEIDQAKRIVGEYSILFPAKTLHIGVKSLPWLDLQIGSEFSPSFDGAAIRQAVITRMRLPVMLSYVDKDHLQERVHARVKFGDKRWGYSVDKLALVSMPADLLAIEIGRVLSWQIAADLTKAEVEK